MVHPLVSARLAALLHPIGAVTLALVRDHRLRGIARRWQRSSDDRQGNRAVGDLRAVGYGLRTGILGAPARATQAASPLLFGLLMDRMGIGVLAMSAGFSLSALVALLLLKARPAPAPVAA